MASTEEPPVEYPFVGESVAARYARARPALHGAALALVTARFGHVRRAIDVGCGTGLSTRALAEAADIVVGTDASEDMIRRTNRSTGASFVLARAEDLPFADGSFGLATVASAIHWFAPVAVQEIRRVLEDGAGLLIYDVWFRAEMVGQPAFTEWLGGISETRYPNVSRNPLPDLGAMGFIREWEEDLRRYVAMASDELVEYLMTHSERIAAITRGQETEEEQRRFLMDGVAPFFGDGLRRKLAFGIRATMFRATRPETPTRRGMTDVVHEAIDEAYAAPLEGWDFLWLEGHAHEVPPPWNFGRLVGEAARGVTRILDIDTGGGEFLAPHAPRRGFVVATEGYAPNVGVAARTLARVGIPLVQTESAPDNVDQDSTDPGSSLPFTAGAFDLVIDRHSSYWPAEIRRVLRPGGRFLTQQLSEAGPSGEAWENLFGRRTKSATFDLAFAVEQLGATGFEIVRAEEADTPIVFADLAGVVYYLRLVPWAVDGFDPAKDGDVLERIADRIAVEGELRIRGSCMLIDASTPVA
jgi:SAM-dependent methyltransferase